MKKTSNEELDAWRLQDKRAPVSLRIKGDEAYAQRFMGEAKALLWLLKNDMRFHGLKHGQRIRPFEDGTVITAISSSGLDIIEINTTVLRDVVGEAVLAPSCAITFLNFPKAVAPMRFPGQIKPGEKLGVDYLKIYYTVEEINCQSCTEFWNLCDTNISGCDQFKFVNPPGYPSKEGEPDNHSIYTTSICHIQLLGHGIDALGRYLIIKVFTEWAWVTPENLVYSRSGLGYGLVWGQIQDATGKMICEVKDVIKVDCCLKSGDDRQVILWDESLQFPGSREFTLAGGNIYYKTPGVLNNANVLYWYAAFGSGAFWVLPDGFGGCFPFEWKLEGIGKLKVSPDTTSARYIPPDNWYDLGMFTLAPITISVKDRCGNEDKVTTEIYNCCGSEGLAPVVMGYTSLEMGCDEGQNFTVSGGCGPYSWECSTGSFDTITENMATYHSPESNAGCTQNPSITVTDRCGNSDTIQVAINCYTAPGTAYKMWYCTGPSTSTAISACNGGDAGCHYSCVMELFDCSGNYLGFEFCTYDWVALGCSWYDRKAIGQSCDGLSSKIPGALYDDQADPGCNTSVSIPWAPNQTFDVRTDLMKSQGCCLLNPFTGAPFEPPI